MYVEMMKCKIHRATVTESNLEYVGSITIDELLMEKAGIYVHEKVQIVNNNNGERFETYAMPGERGSGIICLNGAAARKVQPNDIVIIIAYCLMEEEKAPFHTPKVVFVNDKNQPVEIGIERHGEC